MTGDCPTCGAPTTLERAYGDRMVVEYMEHRYAVPALVRLAQHCETERSEMAIYRAAGGWAVVVNHGWLGGRGPTIEAAAEAALTRLAEEAPNA